MVTTGSETIGLEASGTGHMPSFGEELGRLIPQMRRFARALVKGHSPQIADDLVQETVVLAMRAERLARGPHLRPWCFSNLIRVHRQWHQSFQARGETRSQTSSAAERSDLRAPNGPLAFMPREIARLDLLPIDNREVLLLVVLAGMTYAQAAETLHVTVDTVLARLDLARAVLGREHRTSVVMRAQNGAAAQKPARNAQYLQLVK